MRCDETRQKIVQYIEGTLSSDERQSFEEHLRDCKSCRQELERAREMDSLLKRGAPRYWEEIKPSPAFISRLVSSGPWTTPQRSFNLKEWLLSPWQSRRIVTASLSTALVVALVVLVPRAFVLQGSPPPTPAEMAAPATEGTRGLVSSVSEEEQRVGMEDEGIPMPTPTPMPLATPTPAPAAGKPPGVTPTPVSGVIFSFSGHGSTDSPLIEIRSSPWKLQWSATASAPDSIVIGIVDYHTGEILGEVAGSFTSPGRMDNETLFYTEKGSIYLSIESADSTNWRVEAREILP